ncbi:MAG: GH116 family glycosyl-hydrolase [Candidatus Bathyarchaeota archaeon]|nr:GH116 family glycosyl-hydrolase [Candidatus Bathyarchaeota archaeon]
MNLSSATPAYSGIPLGGLGTGSIEVRMDGRFYEWQIFNNRPWRAGGEVEQYLGRDDLIFALRILSDGEDPVARFLTTSLWKDSDPDITYRLWQSVVDPYRIPWIKPVEKIDFEGKPPFAILRYSDPSFEYLGLDISMEAFSPLIPSDIKNSSIPVAILIFRFKNNGSKEVEISLLSILRNPHRVDSNVKIVNKLYDSGRYTAILFRGEGLSSDHCMFNGSLALTVLGRADSSVSIKVTPDDRRMFSNLVRRLLVDFRGDGIVSGSADIEAYGSDIYGCLTKSIKVKPGSEGRIIVLLAWYYPNHIDVRGIRVGHYYENLFSDVIAVIDYTVDNFDYLYSKTRKFVDTLYDASYDRWLVDLASSQITTLSKCTWLLRDGRFGVWEGGPGCCGFNTVDVALWGITGIAYLYPDLAKNIVFNAERYILDRDKTPYYELFALAFPENMQLYRDALKRDPSIQHDIEKFRKTIREIVDRTGKDPTGRVPHFFIASLDVVDTYDRNDLLPEYILIALLNYYWTGDRDYLSRLWGSIKTVAKAVLVQHDDAGLKLMYHSPPSGYEGFSQVAEAISGAMGRRLLESLRILLSGPMHIPISVNTFDALSLLGVAAFTSDLWIASLKASIEAAKLNGFIDDAKEFERIYGYAVENFVKLLWNGEYFDNWYDPISGMRDRACMSAALTGEWYLKFLLGLDYAFDREKVVSMLKAIYKYNFKRWEGLINAIYPGKPRPALVGDMKYFNESSIPYTIGSQADTPWTGIEIPVATHMIDEGMIDEGIELLRSVHERYRSWGFYWNHIECGGHYFRVLVSLTIFNALAGALYRGVDGILRIDPKVGRIDFKGPILLPGAVVSVAYKLLEGKIRLDVEGRLGSIEVSSIAIRTASRFSKARASIDGCGLEFSLDFIGDEALLKFAKPIKLEEDTKLSIELYS